MAGALDAVEHELVVRLGTKGLHTAVAVDGSQIADKAAQVASRLVEPKRGDQLSVLHISDSHKQYLPRHLMPTHLRNYYHDLAAAAKAGVRAEWVCREKHEGQSTCEALTQLADSKSVNLLVLGSCGRKGEKLDLLGSVSDFSLRSSSASLCIVRPTSTRFDKCKFMFSTDGSHAAALAFVLLVTRIRRAMDIVNVVLVSRSDGVAEQKYVQQYKVFMAKHEVPGSVTVKCINASRAIPDGILEAVKDMDSDVLVLGVSGYGRKLLGSVSEEVSIRAHCTTLIIKDALEVTSMRFSSMGAQSLAKELLPRTPRAMLTAV